MFLLYDSEFSHYAKQIIEIQFWLTTKEDSIKQICLGCVAGCGAKQQLYVSA